jgi:hypothetical protein
MKNTDYDALARLLDGDLPEGEATAEARALSSVAKALEASAVRPRMEHKADLRMALIEAAREQASAPSLLARMRTSFDDSTRRVRYSMRMAAASGAAAMALSGGGVALASHRALPSDPFYNVKLAFEDVRLAFIGDPVARGEQLLAYAERRLVEAELSAQNKDMDGVRRALAEADATSRDAAGYIIRASQEQGDPTLLTMLDEFSRRHRKRLTGLLPLLSGDAATAAEDAMTSLRRITQRVAVLSGPCTRCDRVTAKARADDRRSGDFTGPDAVAAANPDFDFADIPPASEPFAPCPCTTNDGAADAGAGRKPKKAVNRKTDGAGGNAAVAPPAEKPAGGGAAPPQPDPDPQPGPDPKPDPDPDPKPDPEPDDDVRPELPGPVEEPVDEVEDEVDDVVKDVLDRLPTPLPKPPALP